MNKIYQLKNSFLNDDNIQMLTIKIKDTSKSFVISANDLVTKNKEFLESFSTDDIISIIGILAANNQVSVTKTNIVGNKNFLPFLSMIFVACIMASNIAATKLALVFGSSITAGLPAFVLAYSVSSIVSEVYGYKQGKLLVLRGLICNIFMLSLLYIAVILPPSKLWLHQHEFEITLQSMPRLVIASLASYLSGELLNTYTLAKMKLQKHPIVIRILLASFMGLLIDTSLFVFIAFFKTINTDEILFLLLRIYLYKSIFDFLLLPIIIKIINNLKRVEEIDIVDFDTNFSLFSFDATYFPMNNVYKSKH